MALHNWFKSFRAPATKGRTRSTVIVNEVTAAEPPNRAVAVESKREQLNLIQSILEMERRAAALNTSLAALTLKNMNGGRS